MGPRINATDPEHPALRSALPWHLPLEEWPGEYLVPLPRGISRHVVRSGLSFGSRRARGVRPDPDEGPCARAGDEVIAVDGPGDQGNRGRH